MAKIYITKEQFYKVVEKYAFELFELYQLNIDKPYIDITSNPVIGFIWDDMKQFKKDTDASDICCHYKISLFKIG